MKTIKKCLAVLLTLSLLMGLFAALPVSAEEAPPIGTFYDIYDLYAGYCNGSGSSSPWSVEINRNEEGWQEATVLYGPDGDYYYLHGANEWGGNWPGIKFYYPANRSDRYQRAMITAFSVHSSCEYRFDSSYTFTAPVAGTYTLGKGNQDWVTSWDEANSFQMENKSMTELSAGVRVTVNGKTVWPTIDDPNYYEGYARFGNGAGMAERIEVPTLSVVLQANAVLRVEFTQFSAKSDGMPWDEHILGMVSMTYAGAAPEEQPIPTERTFYDIYDLYTNYYTGASAYTPWSVEINKDGEGWLPANIRSERDGDYYYLHGSTEWGGNWPGVKFYYPDNYATAGRFHYAMISAFCKHSNCNYKLDSAYAFRAPYTGNFTLGKGNQDLVLSFDDMNYFQMQNKGVTELSVGVRVTVNGRTVWPSVGDENYYEGYARFGNGEGMASRIEVPTLPLYLEKDDVARVEFTEFSAKSDGMPWDEHIYGLVSMTYDPADNTVAAPIVREYEELSLYSDEVSDSVTTSFEMYESEQVYTTAATYANDGFRFTVNAPDQGVKLQLNGFEAELDHETATLASPGGVQETATVAKSANDLYNIAFSLRPVFADNAVTGTYAELSVNGTVIAKQYDGETPTAMASRGIVIENISSESITIMAGGIALAAGSPFKFNDETNVLYVGEETDMAVVKANIANAGLYTFLSDTVITGTAFSRDNRDVGYTIAVKGDVNSDGESNVLDLVRMKRASAGASTLNAAQTAAAAFGEGEKSEADCLKDIRIYLLTR